MIQAKLQRGFLAGADFVDRLVLDPVRLGLQENEIVRFGFEPGNEFMDGLVKSINLASHQG